MGTSLAECNLRMLTTQDGCDVSFRVGEGEELIQCHSFILISRSRVFLSMLRGGLAETGHIHLPDTEPYVFNKFLRHLYTDTCSPSHDDVTKLLYLADKYDVTHLRIICYEYLEHSLSINTACEILKISFFFYNEKLFHKALKTIFENELFGEEFKSMPHNCFHKVISSGLKLNGHKCVEAAISWAEETATLQEREVTPINIRLALGETFDLLLRNISWVSVEESVLITLMTEDEITSMDRHSPRDSPFFDTGGREVSPGNAYDQLIDFEFYEVVKEVENNTWSDLGGGLDFTSNVDLLLHGVKVYGRSSTSELKFELSLQKCFSQFFLEKDVFDIVTDISIKERTERLVFNRPVELVSGQRYCVYVKVIGAGRGLQYVGQSERRHVTVDHVTISKECQEYVHSMNVVCGLIVSTK